MFLIVADRHGSPSELSARRDHFSAESFSHAIALHACTGSVTLYPERLQLNVGNDPDCYERVRIFTDSGIIVAVMSASAGGRVSWMEHAAS